MPNITNTLIANITGTEDSTQNVIINRTLSNLNFDSTVSSITEYPALIVGDNVIPLPTAIVYQLVVVNRDPIAVMIPKITPKGSTSPSPLTELYPGDVTIIWQKPGSASGGLVGFILNTGTAGAMYEVFFGG